MTRFRSALVTGATGFIGAALARRLLAEGICVYCLVRNPTSHPDRLADLAGAELIEVSSFELPTLYRALARVSAEVVFNLAAYGIDQHDRDPEAMLEGNVHLVARMIEATAGWSLRRFIHTGSCYEYGPTDTNDRIDEQTPCRPVSVYGAAKAASVLYGSVLAASRKVPFVTLRLFGVYGIGEASNRLVSQVIAHLRRDRPIALTAGGQVRDLLYVADVAEAFFQAATADTCGNSGIYNVCSGCGVSIRTVAEAVADEMRKPRRLLRFGEIPYRPDEPMRIVGDNRRFGEATGWKPRYGLNEGIRAMLAAERQTAPLRGTPRLSSRLRPLPSLLPVAPDTSPTCK
jgi:nucleoside-diphosphate-sugar epimerase